MSLSMRPRTILLILLSLVALFFLSGTTVLARGGAESPGRPGLDHHRGLPPAVLAQPHPSPEDFELLSRRVRLRSSRGEIFGDVFRRLAHSLGIDVESHPYLELARLDVDFHGNLAQLLEYLATGQRLRIFLQDGRIRVDREYIDRRRPSRSAEPGVRMRVSIGSRPLKDVADLMARQAGLLACVDATLRLLKVEFQGEGTVSELAAALEKKLIEEGSSHSQVFVDRCFLRIQNYRKQYHVPEDFDPLDWDRTGLLSLPLPR